MLRCAITCILIVLATTSETLAFQSPRRGVRYVRRTCVDRIPCTDTGTCTCTGITTSLNSRVTPDRSDPTADSVDNPGDIFFAIESDEFVLGLSGTIAALIVFYSESTILSPFSQTGCGVPAGPGGIFGAIEGLSYLEVAGIFVLSLINKVTTGSGLPAGKLGALGAAEGLSFLAVFAGVGVLAYQTVHFGYIPNVVPMEGGMCQ